SEAGSPCWPGHGRARTCRRAPHRGTTPSDGLPSAACLPGLGRHPGSRRNLCLRVGHAGPARRHRPKRGLMMPLRAYPAVADAWGPLAAYLGDRFDPALTDPEVLRPFLDREWARLRPHFYRHSVGYLYDLTLFHYSGAKDGFFQTIIDF